MRPASNRAIRPKMPFAEVADVVAGAYGGIDPGDLILDEGSLKRIPDADIIEHPRLVRPAGC